VSKAVARAEERTCECIQIFTTTPRMWAHSTHDAGEIAGFRAGVARLGLDPVVAHASYLLNMASPDEGLRARSVALLAATARWSAALGASVVVIHPGSCADFDGGGCVSRVAETLRAALNEWPAGVALALEQSAGGPTTVGGRFEHLMDILAALGGDARLRVWLDTAHAFSAGYDLARPEGIDRLVADVRRTAGWDRVAGVHANDTKEPLGSRRDRHENIGEGLIGREGFRLLLRHEAFQGLPFLLETPGFDGEGPDLENMTRLKRLRDSTG
jgi:deoxyribonuclease-4